METKLSINSLDDLKITTIVSGRKSTHTEFGNCTPACNPNCNPSCNPQCSPNCSPCYPHGKCNPELFPCKPKG